KRPQTICVQQPDLTFSLDLLVLNLRPQRDGRMTKPHDVVRFRTCVRSMQSSSGFQMRKEFFCCSHSFTFAIFVLPISPPVAQRPLNAIADLRKLFANGCPFIEFNVSRDV